MKCAKKNNERESVKEKCKAGQKKKKKKKKIKKMFFFWEKVL